METTYGYIRVSSRDQKEDRQLDVLKTLVRPGNIYMDKQSGKDFNRPQYKKRGVLFKLNVYLTMYFVFFIFSGQQTTLQGHCNLVQTGHQQFFPPPTWRQSFLYCGVSDPNPDPFGGLLHIQPYRLILSVITFSICHFREEYNTLPEYFTIKSCEYSENNPAIRKK